MQTKLGWWVFVAALVAGSAASFAPAAHAQEDKRASREREALRRAQQALQEAEDAKAAAAREAGAAAAKLAETAGRVRDVSARLAGAEGRARAAQGRIATLEAQLETARQEKAALVAKLDAAEKRLEVAAALQTETATRLAASEAQSRGLDAALARKSADETECQAKNLRLYEYGEALLDQYRHKGVMDALMQRDPVLNLGQVKVDNLLQEYREKLRAQRIASPAVAPSTSR